jgi:naphthoate synthase
VDELHTALDHARMSSDVGCVLLTGNGPSPKDGRWALCSGGDQRIRGAIPARGRRTGGAASGAIA